MENQNTTLNKQKLINIAIRHQDHFKTIREWDEYALKNGLPAAGSYKWWFGSWNAAKKEIGISVQREVSRLKYSYTNEELERIAIEHSEHLTTLENWNNYADKNNLPVAMTFIKRFGKWDELKRKFNNPEDAPRISKGKYGTFHEEDLLRIGRSHLSQFTSRSSWDTYAEIHNLPPSWIFIDFFKSWKEAKKAIGIPGKKEQLEEKAMEHVSIFIGAKSAKEWDMYAQEHDLPPSTAYIYQFGSWSKAKEHISTL